MLRKRGVRTDATRIKTDTPPRDPGAMSASLTRFTVSVARLAARSGQGSRGLRAAALAGGGLAVASLATSGLHTLALSGRWGKEDESAAKLARRAFAAGGPIHGVGFGVLIGALALAGLRTGELPRPRSE